VPDGREEVAGRLDAHHAVFHVDEYPVEAAVCQYFRNRSARQTLKDAKAGPALFGHQLGIVYVTHETCLLP